MKVLLQAIPSDGSDLKAELEGLRRAKAKTFSLYKRNRWVHEKYAGWVWVSGGRGGVLTAEVCEKGNRFPQDILHAFTGFMLRHLRARIRSLHITLPE